MVVLHDDRAFLFFYIIHKLKKKKRLGRQTEEDDNPCLVVSHGVSNARDIKMQNMGYTCHLGPGFTRRQAVLNATLSGQWDHNGRSSLSLAEERSKVLCSLRIVTSANAQFYAKVIWRDKNSNSYPHDRAHPSNCTRTDNGYPEASFNILLFLAEAFIFICIPLHTCSVKYFTSNQVFSMSDEQLVCVRQCYQSGDN